MIERLVRRADQRGQFRFASEAKDLLPARDDYLLAKSHRGLHVLAHDERAAALPIKVLRAAYGPSLEVHARRRGAPVMDVRIGLERSRLPEVREALVLRGVNPSEEYVGMHYCVLRFEAPLATLLGLPGELADLTEGKARHQIVLSRYA